jgi:hypothetical protein
MMDTEEAVERIVKIIEDNYNDWREGEASIPWKEIFEIAEEMYLLDEQERDGEDDYEEN